MVGARDLVVNDHSQEVAHDNPALETETTSSPAACQSPGVVERSRPWLRTKEIWLKSADVCLTAADGKF